ncbi:MAG: TAXI family TRAP transporter solute-binding subunit [Burkholderiaceae bacterium]
MRNLFISSRAIVATLAVFSALFAYAEAPATERTRLITIGSGSVGGVYYPAAGVLCRLLNLGRERHGVRCAVEESSGSVDNAMALINGAVDLGIVQTDVQHDVVKGIGTYRDTEKRKSLRALFSLHSEPVTIVTRLDAGIETFADLVGKRVNVGEAGSGTFSTTVMLMRAFGLSGKDLARQYNLDANEAGLALCENRIDAMVLVVGHPSRTIREVSESCAVRFASVTGDPVREILRDFPYFARATIRPNTYVGQERSVASLGVRASVMTTADLPDELAYEITRASFDNLAAMTRLHPAFESLTPHMMLIGNTADYHPGALRYLTEHGLLAPRPQDKAK